MPLMFGLPSDGDWNFSIDPFARASNRTRVAALTLIGAVHEYASKCGYVARAGERPSIFLLSRANASREYDQDAVPVAVECSIRRSGRLLVPKRADERLQPDDEVSLDVLFC